MSEVEPSDASLTVRRTFDAPRERVFEAWTDPDQVDRWWGPDGFATTTDEMDVRPGGVWRFEMVGPDGESYPNRIVFDEVERPERLAYTHGSPDYPEQFSVTVTFDERNPDGTDLTMEMRFPSTSDRDDALEFGADVGAEQTLDNLADHLANAVGDCPGDRYRRRLDVAGRVRPGSERPPGVPAPATAGPAPSTTSQRSADADRTDSLNLTDIVREPTLA